MATIDVMLGFFNQLAQQMGNAALLDGSTQQNAALVEQVSAAARAMEEQSVQLELVV